LADTRKSQNAEEAAEIKKKRTFRKFTYRGIDLDTYVVPD
jgi:small subunit ribosomal protein S15e